MIYADTINIYLYWLCNSWECFVDACYVFVFLSESKLIFRCLCLAGCNTEIKNSDGIKAEITALKYGFNDISDLLNKIRSVSCSFFFIISLNSQK